MYDLYDTFTCDNLMEHTSVVLLRHQILKRQLLRQMFVRKLFVVSSQYSEIYLK